MPLTTAVERIARADVPALNQGSSEVIPVPSDVKRGASKRRDDGPGEGPIIRAPKPVKRIGRDTARCYCPVCGRKRNVCTGHEGSEA